MSKVIARIVGFFSNWNMVGIDKAGNRYFARSEVIDGVMKEKRWVTFRGEQDPTSIPGLKKEEEQRGAIQGSTLHGKIAGKIGGPDLQSFLRQISRPEGAEPEKADEAAGNTSKAEETEEEKTVKPDETTEPRSTEPIGSGPSFRPGTWQPPS